jgi:hypothetical protein
MVLGDCARGMRFCAVRWAQGPSFCSRGILTAVVLYVDKVCQSDGAVVFGFLTRMTCGSPSLSACCNVGCWTVWNSRLRLHPSSGLGPSLGILRFMVAHLHILACVSVGTLLRQDVWRHYRRI